MSVNKYLPHIFVLPEDDANRQLANGFYLNTNSSQIYILEEARGWSHVRDDFAADHIDKMRQYPERRMVLLIDFDNHYSDRLQSLRDAIPDDLSDRVFVLGALTEPEELKRAGLGSYESIGRSIADDCRSESHTIWRHDLLSHNASELNRLRNAFCKWLFQ